MQSDLNSVCSRQSSLERGKNLSPTIAHGIKRQLELNTMMPNCTGPTAQPWFPFGPQALESGRRMFCLPFAGGGASAFLGWRNTLPGTDVVPVQYPGHETRIEEKCASGLATLVEELAQALAPWLDEPYALFGCSMGARIAFALAHHLAGGGRPPPAALCVAAHPPPDAAAMPPVATLSDAQLESRLRRYGGTAEALLADAELTRVMLPILRADLALAEQPVPREPLPCPINAFAGRQDFFAPPAAMAGWQRFTRGSFTLHDFPGGHFFFRTAEEFLPALDRSVRAAFNR